MKIQGGVSLSWPQPYRKTHSELSGNMGNCWSKSKELSWNMVGQFSGRVGRKKGEFFCRIFPTVSLILQFTLWGSCLETRVSMNAAELDLGTEIAGAHPATSLVEAKLRSSVCTGGVWEKEVMVVLAFKVLHWAGNESQGANLERKWIESSIRNRCSSSGRECRKWLFFWRQTLGPRCADMGWTRLIWKSTCRWSHIVFRHFGSGHIRTVEKGLEPYCTLLPSGSHLQSGPGDERPCVLGAGSACLSVQTMTSLFWFNLGSSTPRDPCILCVETLLRFVVSSLTLGRPGPAARSSRITSSQGLTKIISLKLLKCFANEKQKEKEKQFLPFYHITWARTWSGFCVSGLQGQSILSFRELEHLAWCFRTMGQRRLRGSQRHEVSGLDWIGLDPEFISSCHFCIVSRWGGQDNYITCLWSQGSLRGNGFSLGNACIQSVWITSLPHGVMPPCKAPRLGR